MSNNKNDFMGVKTIKEIKSVRNRKSILHGFHISKILILLCLLLVSTPFVLAQRTSVQAKRAYDRGMSFYQQKTDNGYVEAIKSLAQARNLYQQAGDIAGEALALFRIGQSYRKLNYLKEAEQSYLNSFKLYSKVNKKKEMIFAANNLAAVLRDMGNYQESVRAYQNVVLPNIRKYGSKKDIAKAHNGLGQSLLAVGETSKALSNFKTSLANWRLVKGRDYDKVRANYGSAIAHYRLGNKTAAKNFGNTALRLARKENDPVFEGEVLEALARVYDNDGEKKTAVQYRLQALNVYDRAKNRISVNAYEIVVNNLADVYYRMGDLDNAYKLLVANIRTGVTGKDYPTQTYLTATLGEVLTAQGNFDLAVEAFNASIRLARQAEDKHSEAYALACLGEVYLYKGSFTNRNFNQAVRTYEQALNFYKPGENPYVETKVITGLILAYNNSGRLASARPLIDRIKNYGMHQGNSVSAILALESIAKYNSLSGQHNEAIKYFNQAAELATKRKNQFEAAKILNNSIQSLLALQEYQTAFNLSKVTVAVYKDFGNKYFEANANLRTGWASLNLRKYDDAIFYANQSLQIANNSTERVFREDVEINGFHINGKANFFKGNHSTAINFFNKCLNIVQNTGNKSGQKHFWQDLSITYTAMGDKKKAKKARKKFEKIK